MSTLITTNLSHSSGGTANIVLGGSEATTFNGLSTHTSGVRITGGTGDTVGTGVRGFENPTTGNIGFVLNGASALVINAVGRYGFPTAASNSLFNISGSSTFTGITEVNYARFNGTITLPETGSSLVGLQVNPAISAGGNLVEYTCVEAQSPASLANTGTYIGFRAFDVQTREDNTSYGFYSTLNNATNTGANNYNFYASGTAPSLFFWRY